MADRTIAPTLTVNEFKGLNQLPDELKLGGSFAGWSHGGMCDETYSFRRVLGKKMITPATTRGSVLTIRQLTFASTDFLLVHSGSVLAVATDLSSLRTPEPPSPNPLEPSILWED